MSRERLKKLKAELDKAKEEIRKMAAGVFEKEMASVFEKFPSLSFLCWVQYTPYFNDGDACTFSGPYEVGCFFDREEIPTKENWYDIDADPYDGDEEAVMSDYARERAAERLRERGDDVRAQAALAVGEVMGLFGDEDLEQMFGDHAKVFVTRNGSFRVDYDHD